MQDQEKPGGDIRTQLRETITRLEQVLPGQAPIRDFVHHNTLHGFQRLPFRQAITASRRITGNRGYMSAKRCRALFAAGRIDLADLNAALDAQPELEPDALLLERNGLRLRRRDVYLGALRHPLPMLSGCQLTWQIEEHNALATFQPDVADGSRERLLANAGAEEGQAIADLWSSCLEVLGLEHFILHPEELVDLSPEQAMRMLSGLEQESHDERSPVLQQINREATQRLQAMLDRVGSELTLGGLLRELTGEDVTADLLPLLIRSLASYLDQGLAPWSGADSGQGFYNAWRSAARHDPMPVLLDLPAWGDELDSLPDDAMDTVIAELRRLGLARERWGAYLERLALEIPGWSGMVLWRQLHPGYEGLQAPVAMIDFLAVHLLLERTFAQRLCRRHWKIEASLDLLHWYFRRNGSELAVRHALFTERLPEFLAGRAQRAAMCSDLEQGDRGWQQIAELIWTWRRSLDADRPHGYGVFRSAWPLFRLAQHLGLAGADLRALGEINTLAVLDCLARLDEEAAGYTWLLAYERHYRQQVLSALAQNHGHGRWAQRDQAPSAQLMFCMDDREEGIRRHLEELAPDIETLGAAAHFNVPHNWRGLDAQQPDSLAPVIPAPVIPAHEVREVPRSGSAHTGNRHARRHELIERGYQGLLQGTRRGLLAPTALLAAGAPLAFVSLLGKVLAPAAFQRALSRLRQGIEGAVPTQIRFCAAADSPEATLERPRIGFTDSEQADRVQALLQGSGLTYGFATLVLILGHGSRNQNNPHASAYNCGACSGRFSGPNARLVAAMANRPEVRALLAGRGIEIPDSTWFVGGEHDTCLDRVQLYDTQELPEQLADQFRRLQDLLTESCRLHAQERCRRFASAAIGLSPNQAHRHAEGRSCDFSQARPELGHATNACAFFGRRSMSRGAFFDRRSFLISYDPTQDPDGAIIERHLLTNGAVGAGISLEYYFSSVNNPGYGAGSKVTHNLTGWLGVMEGTCSDLRTGLPKQMIEIHEPMRLLAVVEQTTELLTAIYQRQPPLQEIVGNGWIQLAAIHPVSGEIQLFEPARGWLPWEPPEATLPLVQRSIECYAGESEACPPALIRARDRSPAAGGA